MIKRQRDSLPTSRGECMAATRLSSALGLALLVSACAPGMRVERDWDPEADFASIETFAVLDQAPDSPALTSFMVQRIKIAIVGTMEEKEFREVDDPADADVSVGFQAAIDQRASFRTTTTGWNSYGWGTSRRSSWGVGTSSSQTTQQDYEVGTLIIAIADGDDELMFQSSGSQTLSDGNLSPDEAQQFMDRAVRRILRDFPPEM